MIPRWLQARSCGSRCSYGACGWELPSMASSHESCCEVLRPAPGMMWLAPRRDLHHEHPDEPKQPSTSPQYSPKRLRSVKDYHCYLLRDFMTNCYNRRPQAHVRGQACSIRAYLLVVQIACAHSRIVGMDRGRAETSSLAVSPSLFCVLTDPLATIAINSL